MYTILKLRGQLAAFISSLLLVAVPVFVPSIALAAGANITGNLCAGASLDVTSGSSCADTSIGTDKINTLIHSIINLFSLIVGIVSVVMIIVGGLRYVVSGGDSNNVSGAKNTIVYAIIGLVVVALAQFMVQFVLNKVTSATN